MRNVAGVFQELGVLEVVHLGDEQVSLNPPHNNVLDVRSAEVRQRVVIKLQREAQD